MPRKDCKNYERYLQVEREKRARERSMEKKTKDFYGPISYRAKTAVPRIETVYDNPIDQMNVLRMVQDGKNEKLRRLILSRHREEYKSESIAVVETIFSQTTKSMRWNVEMTAPNAREKTEWLKRVVDDFLKDYDFDYGFVDKKWR